MKIGRYFNRILSRRKKPRYTQREAFIVKGLEKILGIQPKEVSWYQEAFSLKSTSSQLNYDRLEFLGDAVLGSIVSYYLYRQYPQESEGFLTQMKSKIVNRKNLNQIGEKLNLTSLVLKNGSKFGADLSGNLLEALVGAIYMDFGYDKCQKVVLSKILTHSEMLKLENKIISYKSLLLEWSQKNKIKIDYKTEEELLPSKAKMFKTYIFVGGDKVASATETSKKKSEEKAAQRAFYTLNKKEKIIERQ
ncbi:ribonuclease III [Riemerella anatipestifer]|uniref:ribonuclease III n=1 Tax=Riemerella anatipestifer TaxID=34085 RepID=UPI0013750275|nr:ribonuclease III [Riemerella anatipestifer]MDY3339267.1 ribonuclease III [Riemerella anatipestifer]MDY3364009.1 ribonuclease III [Riemerella anatipestifer]MDY3521667.1 ribonuclease III [Riemerella anatipestifer]MDY3533931.1 ribonuclease III [Riemerella anatipestifer]MDY3536145.1 ribonuclease III [Riemerella anatipestifer]